MHMKQSFGPLAPAQAVYEKEVCHIIFYAFSVFNLNIKLGQFEAEVTNHAR